MALHPGSRSEAYSALQEHGWAASTMRHACERAAYSGSFTQGRVTVTFDREAGYRVTTRPLPPLPAQDTTHMIALPPLAVSNLAGVLAGTPGASFALGRLFVQTNRDGSAVIYLAGEASCQASDHAAQLADFGSCDSCGQFADQVPAKPSAAETPGTIASACAFGWS